MEAQPDPKRGYSWEHSQLVPNKPVDTASTLHANPVLAGNFSELQKHSHCSNLEDNQQCGAECVIPQTVDKVREQQLPPPAAGGD